MKKKYRRAVCFTLNGIPINYLQYHLMGYDSMPDDELNREIEDIRAGRKNITR